LVDRAKSQFSTGKINVTRGPGLGRGRQREEEEDIAGPSGRKFVRREAGGRKRGEKDAHSITEPEKKEREGLLISVKKGQLGRGVRRKKEGKM